VATHNGAVAIHPPADDLYRALGVARGATAAQINAAFRGRAKALHPDARPDDPVAAEQFKRLSLAYSVLADPARRARYDAGIAEPWSPVATAAPRARPSPTRWRFGRRAARWAVVGGSALVVLGIAAGMWVASLQRHDAALLADGVAARAVVVEIGGERLLEFVTRSGEQVRTAEATKSGVQQPAVGSTVGIHYDRGDPTRIVVDTSHTARDVTLWIVAVKFLVGGVVLVVLGARRLRRGGT
jgi:hypothetical protein